MEKKIITFTTDEQSLRKTGGIPNYASNKVSYIEAQFELGENWQGFDAVRAIWYNKAQTISMVLADGKCIVPYEVLANKGQVMVNLVGSIFENDVLTDRLTTYPVVALIVDADAKVDGSNTYPITPSQFEQFVEAVKADAESASESAESASASAESASASAKSAHDDKIEIEQKIAEVIQQIEDFEQVEVVVNTLPAGSQATSDFTDGVLTLGIPQGAKGDTGNGIASCVLNADYTLKINFTDGTSYTTTSIRGEQGAKGDTGNGISSITKTGSETVDGRVVDTYTTTFTDGETTEFEVTNGKDGEVTMSQLSSLLPTDTASGDIASFPDGQSIIPAVSVKAQIEPIQDLHGYDKPWSGGNGKNKLPMTLNGIKSANVGTWVGNAYTSNGITFTILVDEVDAVIGINVAGTATYNAYFYVATDLSVTSGQKLNGAPSSGRLFISNRTGTTDYARDTGSGGTVNADATDCRSYIQILNGTTVSNAIYKPMLRESTETDATFAPYSNICPISGHTEVVTEVCWKNLLNPTFSDWSTAGTYLHINDVLPTETTARMTFIDKDTSVSIAGLYIGWVYEDVTATNAGYYNWCIESGTKRTNTLNESTNRQDTKICRNIFIYPNTQEAFNKLFARYDIQVELGTTATAYEPYQGNTYTTTLGRTVYGGTLDVVSGELDDTMGMVDLSTLTWQTTSTQTADGSQCHYANVSGMATDTANTGMISDRFSLASGKYISTMVEGTMIRGGGKIYVATDADTISGQLCYPLATPQTYQLDPTEIALLKGQNNVWTDCGSVEVTYKADIERWVNKKINALI